MKDLKLSASHDIEIASGDLAFAEESEEVAQNCNVRIRTRQGEWKMNVLYGVNWDELWGTSSLEQKEAVLRKAIYECPEVETIHKFQLKLHKPSGTLFVEAFISTIYSDTEHLTFTLGSF
jgi:hypothetical protein